MQPTLFSAYSPIIEQLKKIVPAQSPIYMVGGAIRDTLLQRPTHDLDFILGGDMRSIARKTANHFKGSYFVPDDQRNTARVLLPASNGERVILDFASMQGETIEDDLGKRDFTINAMAYDLRVNKAIDPLGGARDLKNRKLIACATDACLQDPVRILRGVRLALDYELKIIPETKTAMRKAVDGLRAISAERLRDEIFRILDLRKSSTALRILDQLKAIPEILPEPFALKTQALDGQETKNGWELSLSTLNRLEILLDLIVGPREESRGENMMAGMIVLQLGPYRFRLQEHMASRLNANRSLQALLKLAGLYSVVTLQGKEELLTNRARQLALSNSEIQRLALILQALQHLESIILHGEGVNAITLHRYFRDFDAAGVDACLLFLSQRWARHGVYLNQQDWGKWLEAVFTLFEAWWEKHDEIVNPPTLVNGNDLVNQLQMNPGPLVGQLLLEIRELQASGEISRREDAIQYARRRLSESG